MLKNILIITIALVVITVATVFLLKNQQKTKALQAESVAPIEPEIINTAAQTQKQKQTKLSAPLQKKVNSHFPVPTFPVGGIPLNAVVKPVVNKLPVKINLAKNAPWKRLGIPMLKRSAAQQPFLIKPNLQAV